MEYVAEMEDKLYIDSFKIKFKYDFAVRATKLDLKNVCGGVT